ncbi:hypothetical protein F4803DRAFT_575058 [Xylaria telfairii]|nr:hypothetical protein F4803DRAFT_575058 [Xylaria telfairii]
MGRTEPTIVKPPAAFRRDARAKRARATLNKVIPAMLSAHPRARRGIERSELVVDPLAPSSLVPGKEKDRASNGGATDDVAPGPRKKKKKKKKKGRPGDEQVSQGEKIVTSENHGPPRITLCVGDALTAAQALLSRSPSSPSQQKQERKGSVGGEASGHGHKKVGVLNMASPLAPGGGFLNGATGTEASLCLRTTLLPALRDEFYRLPELGIVYTPDVLVFRPTTSSSSSTKRAGDGTCSRSEGGAGNTTTEDDSRREDDILAKNDRWFIDVATAAMLRHPETTTTTTSSAENETGYALASDRELAERKMRAVLRVFAARGCGAVVLGAWGCGAHEGNPISEIAAAWRRVLGVSEGNQRQHHHHHHHHHQSSSEHDDDVSAQQHPGGSKNQGNGKPEDKKKTTRDREREKEKEQHWAGAGAYHHISEVVFAIKHRGTATAFARAFGEDYILAAPPPTSSSSPSSVWGEGGGGGGEEEEEEEEEEDDDDDEDPTQMARVNELREKIAQLEAQAAQVRSPHLKVALERVLAALRRQLPPPEDEHGDDDGIDEGSSSDLGPGSSNGTDEEKDDDDADEEGD